jgi:hypothetical protein
MQLQAVNRSGRLAIMVEVRGLFDISGLPDASCMQFLAICMPVGKAAAPSACAAG